MELTNNCKTWETEVEDPRVPGQPVMETKTLPQTNMFSSYEIKKIVCSLVNKNAQIGAAKMGQWERDFVAPG